MTTLFDVNVLVALVHGGHVHHAAATKAFKAALPAGWATCPLTQNGFLRIMSHPSFALGPEAPQIARQLLLNLLDTPGHEFWSDDLTLTDAQLFPRLPGPKHQTDLYLLGLAAKHGGRLATFDQHIDPKWVAGGETTLLVLNA